MVSAAASRLDGSSSPFSSCKQAKTFGDKAWLWVAAGTHSYFRRPVDPDVERCTARLPHLCYEQIGDIFADSRRDFAGDIPSCSSSRIAPAPLAGQSQHRREDG